MQKKKNKSGRSAASITFIKVTFIPTLQKSTSIGLFIKGPPPTTRTKINTHHSCGSAQRHLASPCLLLEVGPTQKPTKPLASGPPKPSTIREKSTPGRLDSIPVSTSTDPRASALTSLKCADPHITHKPHISFDCTTLMQLTFSLTTPIPLCPEGRDSLSPIIEIPSVDPIFIIQTVKSYTPTLIYCCVRSYFNRSYSHCWMYW